MQCAMFGCNEINSLLHPRRWKTGGFDKEERTDSVQMQVLCCVESALKVETEVTAGYLRLKLSCSSNHITYDA